MKAITVWKKTYKAALLIVVAVLLISSFVPAASAADATSAAGIVTTGAMCEARQVQQAQLYRYCPTGRM